MSESEFNSELRSNLNDRLHNLEGLIRHMSNNVSKMTISSWEMSSFAPSEDGGTDLVPGDEDFERI